MSYESVILSEMNYGGLPFAYWPLEEANGSAAVDLMARARGTDNSGAYVNSPTLNVQPGPLAREPGGWVTINGSSQYVDVGTLGSFGSSLGNGTSIEAWIKSSNTTNVMTVGGVSHSAVGQLAFVARLNCVYNSANQVSAGNIRIAIADNNTYLLVGGTTTNTGVTNGSVHHLVCVADPTAKTVAAYVDGVSKAITYQYRQTLTTWANFSYNMLLGAWNSFGTVGQYYSGSIGRVAIYNYALSADRVMAHYLAGVNGTVNKSRALSRR